MDIHGVSMGTQPENTVMCSTHKRHGDYRRQWARRRAGGGQSGEGGVSVVRMCMTGRMNVEMGQLLLRQANLEKKTVMKVNKG